MSGRQAALIPAEITRTEPTRRLGLSLFLIALLSLGGCQSLYQSDWTPVKEKNGIEFELRPVVGSRIPEYRGIANLPGTVQDMLEVLMDVSSYPEWVYQCDSARVIDTVDYDQIHIYQVNKIPFLRSRDIILHGKIESGTGPGLLRVHLQARPNYCDNKDSAVCAEAQASSSIRVSKSSGFFEAKQLPGKRLEVTWQQHMEPGGLLPAWLVRTQLDNLVFKTFAGLEQQLLARPSKRQQ